MRQNGFLSRIFIALVYLFLYAPIFVLIAFSFNSTKSRTVWSGFSLQWYRDLLRNAEIMDALQTTLLVSVLAAVIATIAGTAAAIGFFSMKRRPRGICLAINNIPMTNADIITGVSLMLLFVFAGRVLNLNFRLGFGTLLLAHITFDIPYVILSVLPKLRQLDPNIYEAAQDLGATGLYAFHRVVFPEIAPGVINGLMIAFTMSIDDFVISYFTAGQTSTLAMVIYSMTRRKVSPEINALSTLMFLVVLSLLLIINLRQIQQERAVAKKLAHAKH
ncbi:MAG: ABC transporter permease [Oscillospiraceae bacterium]|nr:ABC transporter permease [Oscillospiraceae bacterium]